MTWSGQISCTPWDTVDPACIGLHTVHPPLAWPALSPRSPWEEAHQPFRPLCFFSFFFRNAVQALKRHMHSGRGCRLGVLHQAHQAHGGRHAARMPCMSRLPSPLTSILSSPCVVCFAKPLIKPHRLSMSSDGLLTAGSRPGHLHSTAQRTEQRTARAHSRPAHPGGARTRCAGCPHVITTCSTIPHLPPRNVNLSAYNGQLQRSHGPPTAPCAPDQRTLAGLYNRPKCDSPPPRRPPRHRWRHATPRRGACRRCRGCRCRLHGRGRRRAPARRRAARAAR